MQIQLISQQHYFYEQRLQIIRYKFQTFKQMNSKQLSERLTLQNLSQQLQKWKKPYLKQVGKTSKQFQQKVQEHKRYVMEKQEMKYLEKQNCNKISAGSIGDQNNYETKKYVQKLKLTSNNLENTIKNTVPNLSASNVQQKSQRDNVNVHSPKLQQWKSNSQYSFKDYEELVKNYAQVFKKKQKVRKVQKQQATEDFRADQRQMVAEIYNDLKDPMDLTVSFQAIQEFFENYELFYYFYNIHPYRLLNLLKQSARRFENKLTRQQFFDFFLIDRPTISQFKSATEKNVCNNSILQQQTWKKLKSIFDTLDTFGNEQICIRTFFQRIRNHPSSISILASQAIEFPEIGRKYTLQKVLFDLQNKMTFDSKVEWETIQDLISNFVHIQQPSLDTIYAKTLQKAKITKDSNFFLLEPKVLQIIKQIFNRCPKYCNSFVKTSFFCYQLLETGLLKPYLNSATRLQNSTKNTYLSLQQVIKKFSKQAPAYIDMDQMLQLISIKGWKDSRKFISLYDQISSQSSQQQTAQERKQRKLKKIRSLEQLKKSVKKKQKKRPVYEVTQIKQFNLHKRTEPTIRELKVQQMIKQKQQQDEIELKKKFKANPIPVSLNPQRYNKYIKCMQQKKQSILNRLGMKRQQDQTIIDYLKSNTKLFQQKKQKPHCNYLRQKQNYTYEAVPLPLHISEQLLPKIQAEKEERRNKILEETKKKYNEVYWKNIRETSSFENQDSLLQKINQIQQRKQFEQIKANQVPNFEQLHRKFEQELQNRKKKFQPTKIKEFKLSSPAHKNKGNEDQYESPKKNKFKSVSPPKTDVHVDIKSTKKYDDWVAHNQTIMAQKQLQQLKKVKQEEQRQIRQKNFAKMMRSNLSKCTDNTQLLKQKSEQKLKNFKNYVSKLEQQTENQLAQIYVRVLQRPFLFQQSGASKSKSGAKNKNTINQKPKKVKPYKMPPQQAENYPYNQGLFEKQGQQFHPIQSQNLNQSF